MKSFGFHCGTHTLEWHYRHLGGHSGLRQQCSPLCGSLWFQYRNRNLHSFGRGPRYGGRCYQSYSISPVARSPLIAQSMPSALLLRGMWPWWIHFEDWCPQFWHRRRGRTILNGGADVTGGTVNFGTNTLAIYADDAAVSTLGAALTNYRNNTTRSSLTVWSNSALAHLSYPMPTTISRATSRLIRASSV